MDEKVDEILTKLLKMRIDINMPNISLSQGDILYLCKNCIAVLESQPCLLELKSPITVVGDIHGNYFDMLRIFEAKGYPPETNFLFLGDYVDRGPYGLETFCLVMAFKIKFKDNFFILRGNHESRTMGGTYGFYNECSAKASERIWKHICSVFDYLPIAAIINNKTFCSHAGISPHIKSLEDIDNVKRPTDVYESPIITDLVWGDPSVKSELWSRSNRGIGFDYGIKAVDDFLNHFNLELFIRSHQYTDEGFAFPFEGYYKVITIFSAPNYCLKYNNKGAFIDIDSNNNVKLNILNPTRIYDE